MFCKMATIHTEKRRTGAQRRRGLPQPTFPWAWFYVMRVDIPRPLGKLSVSLILYQGGSSTTIRLYVRIECKHSCSIAKLVIFNEIIIMSIWNFKMKFLFLVYIVYNYVEIIL